MRYIIFLARDMPQQGSSSRTYRMAAFFIIYFIYFTHRRGACCRFQELVSYSPWYDQFRPLQVLYKALLILGETAYRNALDIGLECYGIIPSYWCTYAHLNTTDASRRRKPSHRSTRAFIISFAAIDFIISTVTLHQQIPRRQKLDWLPDAS